MSRRTIRTSNYFEILTNGIFVFTLYNNLLAQSCQVSDSVEKPTISFANSSIEAMNSDDAVSVEYWLYTKFRFGEKITLDSENTVDIWFLCNHSQPIKWVYEDNPVR